MDSSIDLVVDTGALTAILDCFSYVLAMREQAALLFNGEDFPKTDVRMRKR